MTTRDYNSVQISLELLTKLFSYITVQDTGYKTECWVRYPHRLDRYAHVSVEGKAYTFHRLMYTLFVDTIPSDLLCDHLCRIRGCCNPSHIEPVTARENIIRGENHVAINAFVTHCPKGHPYDVDNTMKKRYGRSCRECARQYAERKRRAKGVPPKSPSPTCKRGHPFSADNTSIKSLKGGGVGRRCLTCHRIGERNRAKGVRYSEF